MTIEKTIEILKEYRDKLSNSVSNQLDEDIETFDAAIKALEQSKWILVNKQLPIKSDYYLATIKESSGETVVRSVWYDGEWKIMSVVPNVIAWMPLPGSYKAESEG